MMKYLFEMKEEQTAEQRPYVSQYWVVSVETRPLLRVVAGPFNDRAEAYGAFSGGHYKVVETRNSIYHALEEHK
jgi:hypothetical protein